MARHASTGPSARRGGPIGRNGLVRETRIAGGIPALDAAAAAAVRQWRFKPATVKGEPVAVWVAIPVKFKPH